MDEETCRMCGRLEDSDCAHYCQGSVWDIVPTCVKCEGFNPGFTSYCNRCQLDEDQLEDLFAQAEAGSQEAAATIDAWLKRRD